MTPEVDTPVKATWTNLPTLIKVGPLPTDPTPMVFDIIWEEPYPGDAIEMLLYVWIDLGGCTDPYGNPIDMHADYKITAVSQKNDSKATVYLPAHPYANPAWVTSSLSIWVPVGDTLNVRWRGAAYKGNVISQMEIIAVR